MIYLNYFSSAKRWERKLQKLDRYRPKLGREEYIVRFVIRGFKSKHIKVVYDEIESYLSLDEFSMYCNDDVSKYYLREQLDIIKLLENVYTKLKIDINKRTYKLQYNNELELLTVASILNLLSNKN